MVVRTDQSHWPLSDIEASAAAPRSVLADTASNEELKQHAAHLEKLDDFLNEDVHVAALALTPEEQRKVWRKIDSRIIWPMALIYLL